MSTQKDTVEFLLEKLGDSRFTVRSMFGEYALYASGKTVAFVCDDLLYVKILPASAALENVCEKGPPYPGAKPYYIVEEPQLSSIEDLPAILFAIAQSLPAKKNTSKKRGSIDRSSTTVYNHPMGRISPIAPRESKSRKSKKRLATKATMLATRAAKKRG